MDALSEIKRLNEDLLRTMRVGGDALGTAPGGKHRAKGYARALLDAAVAVLSERADDGRPVGYMLARAVLRDDLSPEDALRLHRLGIETPL